MKKVHFFKHSVGKEELKAVERIVKSNFLTTGEATAEFESRFANYLGVRHATGLTSCTGALHLALLAAGVKSGDEVITTPMSYVATAHSIVMAGARPVFVDIEADTGNIDARKIEAAITKKTKAILPVHLYGQMADMKEILKVAKKHGLVVIEDAAHALESERDGIRPGQKSFGACFSFYATKSITSGEGGAFATNNAKTADLVKSLRNHGVTIEADKRQKLGVKTYDVDRLGWKYNMDNLKAAMLIPQIKKTDSYRSRREVIASEYRRSFSRIGITMLRVLKNGRHSNHLFPILVPPEQRDAFIDHLSSLGVGSPINYRPIHLFSFYKKNFGFREGDFPIAEDFGARVLSLPLYSRLKDSEVGYIIQSVHATAKEVLK